MDQAAALKSENPIEWLDKKPNNYLGEVATEELAKLPVGNWVWDKSDRALVYLLNNRKSFAAGQSNMLKFKVKSVRLPPETAKQDPRSAEQAGLLLVQM
jgi:general secretion pathway protein G